MAPDQCQAMCACLVRAKEMCECRGQGDVLLLLTAPLHSGLEMCLEEEVPGPHGGALCSAVSSSEPPFHFTQQRLAGIYPDVMGAGMYYPCKEEAWGAVRISLDI